MERVLIVYDDRCGLCRAWMRWVKARDKRNLIEGVSCPIYALENDPAEISCDEVIFVTSTGTRYGGGQAIPQILKCLPNYRWAGTILGWKLFNRPLNWGYRVLARNRMFLTFILGKWTHE